MIDLKEPARVKYTAEEELLLKKKFILLLHTFLLGYLLLHNLLIPVVNNLFREQEILSDVHFWFIAHLPLQFLLRKGRQVPWEYVLFLFIGSVSRTVVEGYLAPGLRSWSFTSAMISEFSCFLFFFVLRSEIKRTSFGIIGALPGVVLPLLLSQLEVRTKSTLLSARLSRAAVEKTDSGRLGCKGSRVELAWPLNRDVSQQERVIIQDCGFASTLLGFNGKFRVVSQLKYSFNLRLYRLNTKEGRARWKFVRLLQVLPGEEEDLTGHLKSGEIHLLKSPERRQLGHVVLLPLELKEFPLGTGVLRLDYDTVRWNQKENHE